MKGEISVPVGSWSKNRHKKETKEEAGQKGNMKLFHVDIAALVQLVIHSLPAFSDTLNFLIGVQSPWTIWTTGNLVSISHFTKAIPDFKISVPSWADQGV